MPFVRLHFPVTVVIQPVDEGATDWNTRAREPVHRVARAPDVEVRAQVQFTIRDRPVMTEAGSVLESTGYLVVLTSEIDALSYTPRRGDRISSIPGEQGAYYVTNITPHAHKGGRNRTLHLHFEGRRPVRS